MKYCPVCGERYDEDIIRFCTKDGTPLVDEEGPNFTTMPSENIADDDAGEETVIRRKPVSPVTNVGEEPPSAAERIVIPTTPEPRPEPTVRPRPQQTYYAPPERSNTAKTVLLTVIGTLMVLGLGAVLFKLFQKEPPTNTNVNINLSNQNSMNANNGFDANFPFNMNVANSNIPANVTIPANVAIPNLNTNVKVPSPTPTVKPSPTVSPTPTASPVPSTTPSPRSTNSNRPTASPTPRNTPARNDNANKPSGLPINR